MKRLTEQEVSDAFRLMHLETPEARSAFAKLVPAAPLTKVREFTRLDNTTQKSEVNDAELAQAPSRTQKRR